MASPTSSSRKSFFGFGSTKKEGAAATLPPGSPQSSVGSGVDNSIAGANAELRAKLRARRRGTVANFGGDDVALADDNYAEGGYMFGKSSQMLSQPSPFAPSPRKLANATFNTPAEGGVESEASKSDSSIGSFSDDDDDAGQVNGGDGDNGGDNTLEDADSASSPEVSIDDVSVDSEEDELEARLHTMLKRRYNQVFRRLHELKAAWVRITLKNVRVDNLRLARSPWCYFGGFTISLKVTLGSAFECWVDSAQVKYADRFDQYRGKSLVFEAPVVITVPKFLWETRSDFLLFEFYRDRTYFLMPSTRWGFVTLERPDVELADDDDDDEDDDDEDDKMGDIDYAEEPNYGYANSGGNYGEEEEEDEEDDVAENENDDDNDDGQQSTKSVDDGEALQLARDEAAFAASQKRSLVVGDSVHWQGADSDLPAGTTGAVTQVYGDGDIEVLFQGALSENKVFTFEEGRLTRLKTSAEVTQAITLSQRRQELDAKFSAAAAAAATATGAAGAAASASKPQRKPLRKSVYRGVFWDPDTNLWIARMKTNGKVQLLGKFASEVDAARKYDKQALLLGKNLLNFPDEVGLAQSAKKSKARRGSLRYTSPPLAAPAAALRGVQGGSRSDSASPGIRRGSGNIGGSSSYGYGYDINNSGGRGGTKYHRLGNRDEFDDEEAGRGMPRTQRNRRSGSTSQAPGLGSSLPVDDWLRCKAALKMGRPMWETLGQFQLSAAADARAHNLATQLSQAAPMHATRLGLALQQQQPGLSNSSGGFGTAIGGAGAGMGIDGGNRRSSTRIMRRRTSAIGVPEARSSVAIAEFDALKDHYAIAHGVSAHAFAAAFRREVQQRDDEGQGAGGVSNVTPGKRHSKGGKVRFAAELDAEASINSSSSTHNSGNSSRDQKPFDSGLVGRHTTYRSHLLKTNALEESHWHSLRNMPVHAEAAQSAAYQGFKECCAPLEAVVGFISHYLCGREVIPDVVHRRTSDEPSAKKQPGNNNHETDSNDGADGSESNQKANGHQKRWDSMTSEEKRIAIARRKRLGRLSCDLLYERLPPQTEPLKGVTFRDWLAASDLHGSLPELELSDRELLVSLVNTFVNSQTTVMLLFFAVDIDELRWHDFVLLSLVFVILEFLLLVACNAIQEKRARFYVFHKALRHGVIIDFENLDDPTTKYLQFPYVLGMLGAVVSALLIFSEPNLSFFGKASSAFLIAITINTGMLTPFAELDQVEDSVMSLPKFVEASAEDSKKALVMMRHQDEYISLLHLRRIVQKQRWLKKHAPSRAKHAAFDWTMLSIECYQVATTKTVDSPATHTHLHHFNPATMVNPGESEQRARKRFEKRQQLEQARKAARAPWFPLEWAIPPMVIDFLPIWYEKRSGKIMLPDNMDRSFRWKFAAQFFAYSVLGGIRDWGRVADSKLRAKERARFAATIRDSKAANSSNMAQPPLAPASAQAGGAAATPPPRRRPGDRTNSNSNGGRGGGRGTGRADGSGRGSGGGRGRGGRGNGAIQSLFNAEAPDSGGSAGGANPNASEAPGGAGANGISSYVSPYPLGNDQIDHQGLGSTARQDSILPPPPSDSPHCGGDDAGGEDRLMSTSQLRSSSLPRHPESGTPFVNSGGLRRRQRRRRASMYASASASHDNDTTLVSPENVIGLALSPSPRVRLAPYAFEFQAAAAAMTTSLPSSSGGGGGSIRSAKSSGGNSKSTNDSVDSNGSAIHRHVMELLREVNAESGSLDGQGGDGGGASATPLTSAAHASAQSPDHAPLPTPFDLNLTREQYITLIRKVNDDYNILSDREVLSLPQLHRVELKQLLATTMDALELREEEAAMELAEDLRFMHYSFWRWTSILMELEFANPVDNACTRNLRAFRFYSKLFMVVAATLYVNAALAHSPGLSKPHGPEDAGRAARGSLMPSLQPTVRPYV